MKRIILITLIFLNFAYGFAQYNDNQIRNFDMTSLNLDQLKFGVKVSPSISWVNVTHNDAFAGGATLKIGVGLTANYEMNEILQVISGINYNSIGGYMADRRSLGDVKYKDYFKTNYQIVEVPLGLRIKTPTVNKYNYYLHGGVTSGFILSANEKMYSASSGKVYNNIDTLKDLTNPSIVGYFAGVGLSYSITERFKIFAEVNYKNALTSISNGENYMIDSNHAYSSPIYIIPANMEFSFGLEF